MNIAAPWFYFEGELTAGGSVRLDEAEAQHATGSKRLNEGDDIVLFDGRGAIAPARITMIGKRGRQIEVEIAGVDYCPPLTPAVTVASGVPKGERAGAMLNMITQVGLNIFIPLQCERSVATGEKLTGLRGRRIVIEACKQARVAHLPAIMDPMSPGEVVERAMDANALALAAHPTGLPMREVARHHLNDSAVTLLIGPEGGFTEKEVNEMREGGAHVVNLGRTILRTETACVAMLSFARMYHVPG